MRRLTLGANGAQVTTNGTNPQGPRALNISTRLQIQSGDNALFAGFIITGPAGSTKRVLIRGIGPSLAQFGVPGTIPDPFLELHGSGAPITNNDLAAGAERERDPKRTRAQQRKRISHHRDSASGQLQCDLERS